MPELQKCSNDAMALRYTIFFLVQSFLTSAMKQLTNTLQWEMCFPTCAWHRWCQWKFSWLWERKITILWKY